MKMTRASILLAAVVLTALVAHAATVSYNRDVATSDIQTTRNCNSDGTGTISYSATGTMSNGNAFSTSGTVTLVGDHNDSDSPYAG
jgi:hypothetical protein